MEFALIAPILMMFVFGIAFYSALFVVMSGVQQLAAESARAALAGLSSGERDQIARNFIATNVSAYPLIDSKKLIVSTSTLNPSQFQVSVSYDLSNISVFRIGTLMTPFLGQLQRSAIVGLSYQPVT